MTTLTLRGVAWHVTGRMQFRLHYDIGDIVDIQLPFLRDQVSRILGYAAYVIRGKLKTLWYRITPRRKGEFPRLEWDEVDTYSEWLYDTGPPVGLRRQEIFVEERFETVDATGWLKIPRIVYVGDTCVIRLRLRVSRVLADEKPTRMPVSLVRIGEGILVRFKRADTDSSFRVELTGVGLVVTPIEPQYDGTYVRYRWGCSFHAYPVDAQPRRGRESPPWSPEHSRRLCPTSNGSSRMR